MGDGTTSSVVLAGALIEKAEDLINKDVHPSVIVDGYNAAEHALKLPEDCCQGRHLRQRIAHQDCEN